MKRDQRAIEPARGESSATGGAFRLESGLFTPSNSGTAQAFFAPLHYEPNYAYPLIVWLHGPGCDEFQLMRIMPIVSMRNYVAVAPRGFRGTYAGVEGETWGWSQDPRAVDEAEQRVLDAVEAAMQKYHVAPHRVFVAGFDCGGTMALRAAMNHPRRFAGAVSVGGAFPRGQTPLGQWAQARQLAVFLAFGHHSPLYSPEQACEDLRLCHAAGISTTLRQYPCGHQLSPDMLGDMDRWFMEQITAPQQSRERPGSKSACPPD
jgi:phospholipase/carboxylesterase